MAYYTKEQIEQARQIDLLTYLQRYEPSKNSSKMKLPVALQNMLEDHAEVTNIALHLDNDKAGKSAAWSIEWQLKDKYNVLFEPPPRGKDFNDYLRTLL